MAIEQISSMLMKEELKSNLEINRTMTLIFSTIPHRMQIMMRMKKRVYICCRALSEVKGPLPLTRVSRRFMGSERIGW